MKTFIYNMMSDQDNVSSKRVMGVLSLMIYYGIYATTYFTELKVYQIEMANTIFYGGVALLGLGVLEKFKKL